MKTKIKICGITRSEDALLAAELGAWAIGFVFSRRSSRSIEPKVAGSIRRALPKAMKTFGVFVNASVDEIVTAARDGELDTIQLHGDESETFCAAVKAALPSHTIVKAIRVRTKEDLVDQNNCDAVLLDSYVSGQEGGTGQTFNWDFLSDLKLEKPLILSGGLRAENVALAIRKYHPYALDVSSGVEKRAGLKDESAMRAFFAAVRGAE